MAVAVAPPQRPLRVTVVTVAHRGDDARIAFRQIGALRSADASVRYIAPPPVAVDTGVERRVISRAIGWRRARSWWQAHREVRRCRGATDILIVHDLEAVIPVRLARPGSPIVWDVHEDMVASVDDRTWIPAWARLPMRYVVATVQRIAAHRSHLILAEASYRERLGDWPIVPNSTTVPASPPTFEPPARPYVIYVGRISVARGLHAMTRLGRDLAGVADVVLVGPVDDDVRGTLLDASAAGTVDWRGPLSNPQALALIAGASAGLCLLDPLPNYVVSMPTKVYEYFAHGVPAIVSPLPLAVEAIEHSGGGAVVDPHDPAAVVSAVRTFVDDSALRRRAGQRAHAWVAEHHDWGLDGRRFVAILTEWAREGGTPGREASADL